MKNSRANKSNLSLTIGSNGCVNKVEIGSQNFKVDGKRKIKLY